MPPARARLRPRPGVSLAELLAALTVAAILAAAGTRAVASAADGAATHAAAAELRATFASARTVAVLRSARTAVHLDSTAGVATVHVGSDTVQRLLLRTQYGVRLAVTRDSMAYAPLGIGYGAANLRAVLTRGRASDTVTVSRLGRVR